MPDDGRGLPRTDFNGDGKPDFLIGVYEGELLAFFGAGALHSATEPTGKDGKSPRSGARLTLVDREGRKRAAEADFTLAAKSAPERASFTPRAW